MSTEQKSSAKAGSTAYAALGLAVWLTGIGTVTHLARAAAETQEPAGDAPSAGPASNDETTDLPLPPLDAGAKKPATPPGEGEPAAPRRRRGKAKRPQVPGIAEMRRVAGEDISTGVRVEDIVEPPSDYRYAAFGKADPFLPPMIAKSEAEAEAMAAAGGAPSPQSGRSPQSASPLEIPIVSPLQRHDLSELSVIGIWQLASGERKAMLLVPAAGGAAGTGVGQGIIVKIGDPVGNRGGKILAIAEEFLTVREFSLAPDGTRQYNDQQLYMGKRNPDEIPGKIRFTPGTAKTEVLTDKGIDFNTAVEGRIERPDKPSADRAVPLPAGAGEAARLALPSAVPAPAGGLPAGLAQPPPGAAATLPPGSAPPGAVAPAASAPPPPAPPPAPEHLSAFHTDPPPPPPPALPAALPGAMPPPSVAPGVPHVY